MQREEAVQSLCQFVNDVLTSEIMQPYQIIVDDWRIGQRKRSNVVYDYYLAGK